MVHVEVLYFDGCPSWHRAWSELGAAIVEAGVDAEVRLRSVEGVANGDLTGFGGSPTILIEGRDLEGFAGPPVWACRRYVGNEGRGWPSREQIRDAVDRLG